jgi:hypothetical protein
MNGDFANLLSLNAGIDSEDSRAIRQMIEMTQAMVEATTRWAEKEHGIPFSEIMKHIDSAKEGKMDA